MKAQYTEKDQIPQEETTRYWFDVEFENDSDDNGQYAVSDCNGEITYLDSDGGEVDQRLVVNLEKLLVVTDEMINDY